MSEERMMSLQPGTVISGRYEIVKCLGAGSMGLVYACRRRDMQGMMVAMKVLFPEVAQDKLAAKRFRLEVFAAQGVAHPNVVRAYEYLRDGDLQAYTMEYVSGGDLAGRLSKGSPPIPIPEIVRLLSQMSSGVQAIHDSGIVHRDLKPENILLSKEGDVKVADFGIAKDVHGQKLTEHGGVVGTIDYVAPEYMLNSQVDWRSDIYALGILGYEMLTGESPFRGETVYETMTKRLKTDPKPPSELRANCPKELDTILLKAMHRDPLVRYQSAAEMFYELQALGELKDTDSNPESASVSPSLQGAAGGASAISGFGGGASASRLTSSKFSSLGDGSEYRMTGGGGSARMMEGKLDRDSSALGSVPRRQMRQYGVGQEDHVPPAGLGVAPSSTLGDDGTSPEPAVIGASPRRRSAQGADMSQPSTAAESVKSGVIKRKRFMSREELAFLLVVIVFVVVVGFILARFLGVTGVTGDVTHVETQGRRQTW